MSSNGCTPEDGIGGSSPQGPITKVIGLICMLHVIVILVMMSKIDNSAPPGDAWPFPLMLGSFFIFLYVYFLSADQDSAKDFYEKWYKRRTPTSKDRSDTGEQEAAKDFYEELDAEEQEAAKDFYEKLYKRSVPTSKDRSDK